MLSFNQAEIQMILDSIDLSIASNKRMQNSKPQFKAIFDTIANDLNALRLKVSTPIKPK